MNRCFPIFESMSNAVCETCEGKGVLECPKCEGKGKYYKHTYFIAKIVDNWETCLGCGGSGEVKCSECGGRGVPRKKGWLRRLLPFF